MTRSLAPLVGLALLAGACPRRGDTAAPEVASHREGARAVLEARCALCHLPEGPDPEFRGLAIHVFDLSQADWSAPMSDAQLHELIKKVADDGPTAEELQVVERFVADEVAWRDRHPRQYLALERDLPVLGTR